MLIAEPLRETAPTAEQRPAGTMASTIEDPRQAAREQSLAARSADDPVADAEDADEFYEEEIGGERTLHFIIFQFVYRVSNAKFYQHLFGDSSYVTGYLQWIGWDLSTVFQTGSVQLASTKTGICWA